MLVEVRKMIKVSDVVPVFASGRLGLVSVVLCQFQGSDSFNDTLLADVHFGAATCWCTR